MEVLSSLLNLGLYDRAEEIAKDKATERRRKLAALHDRMSVLDTQMAAREQVESELSECEKDKALYAAQMTAVEGQIKAQEREEADRQSVV